MTAPSLILLGHGSNDPRVAQVSHEIRAGILEIRSDLDISIAFLDHYPPTGLQVVNQLAKRGVSEVVFVPLLLSDAFQAHAEVPALIAQVQGAHPGTPPTSKSRSSAPSIPFTIVFVSEVPCCTRTRAPT